MTAPADHLTDHPAFWVIDMLSTVLGTTEAVTDVNYNDADNVIEFAAHEDDGTIGLYTVAVRKVGTADSTSGATLA